MLDRVISNTLFTVASFAIFFGVWELTSRTGLVNGVLLPPPSVILPQLWVTLLDGSFLSPLLDTMTLLFIGYAIACVLGIAIGTMMGISRTAFDLFEPLIETIRPVPKVALVPPLFLFLGLGTTMKVTTVALAAFFPVLIGTIQGIRGVDRVSIDTARTFGVSRLAIVFKVMLPAALPMILTGMRVSLGIGLILVVLAEMLSGEGGLGAAIMEMQRSFTIVMMYVWILILAAIGFALNWLFERFEDRMVPWRAK
jgi:ABC-type nitrate/sulfonate/bicarbonate transport system permease component